MVDGPQIGKGVKEVKHHVLRSHRGVPANVSGQGIPQVANGAPVLSGEHAGEFAQDLVIGTQSSAAAAGKSANDPNFIQKMGGVGNVMFLVLPGVPALVQAVTGGLSKVGEWTNFKPLENWGKNAKLTVKGWSEKTIGEVFDGKVSKTIEETATKATNFVGDGVNKVTEKTGAGGVLSKIPAWRANQNYNAAMAKLGGADAIIADLPEAAKPHARNIVNSLKPTTHVSQVHAESFAANNKSYADAVGALENVPKAQQDALKAFQKSVLKPVTNAVDHHVNANGLNNIGGMVKELPGSIKKSAVIPGVMNTAFIGMSGYGMYSVAKDFSGNLASLKQMAHDIDGKDHSTIDVLTGNVPKVVADARGKLLLNFGISEATGLAGLVVSIMSAAKGKMGVLGFMAPQFIGMGANAIVGESAVSYYKGMKDAHAAGNKLSADDYALLIGNTSPELKARGGEKGAFTKTLAAMYAEQNISPQQIMQEIENGAMMKRVHLLMAENEAANDKSYGHTTSQKSHVAALTEPTKVVLPQKEREVVGDKTAELVAKSAAANDALARGGA